MPALPGIESAAAALCGRSSKQFAHFPSAFRRSGERRFFLAGDNRLTLIKRRMLARTIFIVFAMRVNASLSRNFFLFSFFFFFFARAIALSL